MLGRIAVCVAAAVVMLPALCMPAPVAAKGLSAAPAHHAGVFRPHLNRHARHHHRRHPNNNGFGYWPVGFDYGPYPAQQIVVPVGYPIYVGPRCTPSVETVIVPAERGGERKIRITRC